MFVQQLGSFSALKLNRVVRPISQQCDVLIDTQCMGWQCYCGVEVTETSQH